MPAYKDSKTGTWYVQFWYKDWTGKQKKKMTRGFETRREAVQYEADFKARKAGCLDMKLKDFVTIYEEERFPRLKEVTRETKHYIIQYKILPYFGEMKLNDITSTEIIRWQNELLSYRTPEGKPYSKSYLKELHTQINAIFNYAVRYYRLPSNPAAIAGNFGSDNEITMDFWTTEEYLKFSDQMMDEPPYYYCFQVLYWLGTRVGETLALTKEDFDLEKGIVNINKTYQVLRSGKKIITTPKTPKSVRTITIPEFLCEELAEYFDMLPPDSNETRIFHMLSKYSLQKHMKKGSAAAGIKKIRIHDLRHSHVSLLINMGYSAVAIADRMGHESVHITYRYAHLFPSIQQDMASRLNDLATRKE